MPVPGVRMGSFADPRTGQVYDRFQVSASYGKDSRGSYSVPRPAPAPAPAAAPAAAPAPTPAAAPAPAPAPPPAPPVTASGEGGSVAAQATTAAKDRAEASYRESLPATTHKQNPWISRMPSGAPGAAAHNFRADSNNANLATQGMLDGARAAQESTTRSADRFDAIALNASQWMSDIDSRNLSRLSPSLALPRNPTEALREFYTQISDDMRKSLGPFA